MHGQLVEWLLHKKNRSVYLERRAGRAASNPLSVYGTQIARSETHPQILRIIFAFPQVRAIDSGLVDRFTMCGVVTDGSLVRAHQFVHERHRSIKHRIEARQVVLQEWFIEFEPLVFRLFHNPVERFVGESIGTVEFFLFFLSERKVR